MNSPCALKGCPEGWYSEQPLESLESVHKLSTNLWKSGEDVAGQRGHVAHAFE